MSRLERQAFRYILLNKPYRVLCEWEDPEGRQRRTLRDLLPLQGLEPAGRLDYASEGLVLLTDDGKLLHRLTHPRYAHPKVYWVLVEGIPDAVALETLRQGVLVKGEKTKEAEVRFLTEEERRQIWPREGLPRGPSTWLCMVLREGHKHQVRHMTAAVGHPTLRLIRTAIGPLTLGELAPGQWRPLTLHEVALLRRVVARRAEQGSEAPRN